jgi:hypothetical protein
MIARRGSSRRRPGSRFDWHAVGMRDGLPIQVDDVPAGRWEYGEVGATRRRLGVASGAERLGIALIEIDAGKRSTATRTRTSCSSSSRAEA